MSRLKLFAPEEFSSSQTDSSPSVAETLEEPQILPFRSHRIPSGSDSMLDILLRAQQIRVNRTCPDCQSTHVEPVELNDAIQNRNGMPIPGSATLVGFRCNQCEAEWPV